MSEWSARLAAWLIAGATALAAGCASYSGSSLVPGKSNAAEVESSMGIPVEKQGLAGETIWWYPRGPLGFHSYAVRIGPDGMVRAVEQRLTAENISRVVPGKWTKQDVHDLFGPPFIVSDLPRLQREVWEYQLREYEFKWKLWVQFSDEGVVREVLKMRHPDEDPPGAAGKD